jgi:hypothetical protein
MEDVIRKFTLEKTRFKSGGIVDAIGRTGLWPFRRTISYHVGINCDAISVIDGRLHALRRGRSIAIAELIGTPTLLQRLLRGEWTTLLHPRHRALREASGQSSGLRWEDLLGSRRRK